jgi:hypothetical protein
MPSKFTSANPVENSTLAEAQKLVKQRGLYRLPCHGIFVNPSGGSTQVDYIAESDFSVNGIKPEDSVRLLIKTATGPEGGHGGYVNVGMTLDRLKRAPSLQVGVVEMISEDLANSGQPYQSGDAAARMTSTPAVSSAIESALKKEWGVASKSAAEDPIVDPGPL